jgi:hypothetical protein
VWFLGSVFFAGAGFHHRSAAGGGLHSGEEIADLLVLPAQESDGVFFDARVGHGGLLPGCGPRSTRRTPRRAVYTQGEPHVLADRLIGLAPCDPA